MKIERREQLFKPGASYIPNKHPVYRLTPETEEEAKVLSKMATELYHTNKALELRFLVYPDGERSNPKFSEAPEGLDFIVNTRG